MQNLILSIIPQEHCSLTQQFQVLRHGTVHSNEETTPSDMVTPPCLLPYLLHRWVCRSVPGASAQSGPSASEHICSTRRQGTGKPAPWTHTRSISDTPNLQRSEASPMFVLCKFLFSKKILTQPQCFGVVPEPTSSESPEITRAQSCFRRKAFSSRWASPRLVTWGKRWQLRKRLLHWGEKTNKQVSEGAKVILTGSTPSYSEHTVR